ncbi:TPA: diphthine synthase [archaeon]|uniref:Diphthine synthase n=1 Tax=Candidatus Naiadarchaeum limnaeum TaxID=2756139 RepID=A0A832URH5_9ARCH|nr:diphthine synthase [Candidatus Naiadarchaeales archaeon SRR2090153.bin1042]HIK00287.1 diphthine synthase [Candidatus Naiadarchaeum limnaeum]
MIKLIGLGLWNEKSMSLEALEEAKDCDVLYVEFYTSRLTGLKNISELENQIGKEIKVLNREQFEGKTKNFLQEAREKNIGILVAGDALTATTHIDLLIEAKKGGIEFRVVHGSSIYTAAAGLSGLQIYKFGRATSIPFFKAESPYDILAENKKAGLHTLIFLDIQNENLMSANEAMKKLIEIEKKKKKKVFTENTEIVIVARAGSENPLVKFGKVKELLKEDFGGPMHVLIVPGKLHFKEREALELNKF